MCDKNVTGMLEGRLERVRSLMGECGYDAVILRSNPDLRWLTGAARVFDDEVAHTAIITHGGAWLHTDSRYYGSFLEHMQDASLWTIDMGQESHAAWCAARIKEGRARVVAIEDTVTLGFFEELQEELNKRSCACLMPRLHGDMARMRMVKDSEELELLRKAQRITDEAFEHICGFSTYTTTVNLNIRQSPNGDKKLFEQITQNAKLHSYENENGFAVLKKDSKVTCKNIVEIGDDIWIEIPSGYIAAYHNKKTYVV